MMRRGATSSEARLTLDIGGGSIGSVALAVLACAVTAASLAVAPGIQCWFGVALGLLMLAIAVIDARSCLIPNQLSLSAFVLALVSAAASGSLDAFSQGPWHGAAHAVGLSILRAVVLGSAFLALREIYARLRGREGIGLGDVKLAAVAGAWLDWPLMPVAVEIAALAGLCAYALGRLKGGQPFSATARLPFGLFLAPAIWLCWLWQSGVFI